MRDLYIRRMELLEPVPRDNYLAGLPVVKHLAENGIALSERTAPENPR